MLAHDVEWDVPGDTEHVPWLGRRTVEQVPGFFEAMAEHTIRKRFDVERIVVDGPAAVIIGYAGVRLQATNEPIGSRFAIELIVNADGKITRFYMFEDSWKAASAVRPHLRRAPSQA
jgi:hypothetical protein